MSGTLAIGPGSSQKADARPISFLMNDAASGDPPAAFEFFIRPEDLTRQDPSRLAVLQTLGGAWADNWGRGLAQISIAGHTGWRQDFTGNDGIDRWLAMREMCFDGWHRRRDSAADAGKDPDGVQLVFSDALDSFAVAVAPGSISLRRSRSRPLLLQYQLSMTVLGDVDVAALLAGDLSSDDLLTLGLDALTRGVDALNRGLASISAIVNRTVNAILRPVRAFMAATNKLYSAVLSLNRTVLGVTGSILSIATVTAQAGMNLFRSVALIASLPAQVRGQFMAVASVYSGIVCLMAKALRAATTWDDYSALYGASNCSSTSGGRPLGQFPGVNPLLTLLPAPAVPIASLSAPAQVSASALAGSDPVLAPMSLDTLANHAATVGAGLEVRDVG